MERLEAQQFAEKHRLHFIEVGGVRWSYTARQASAAESFNVEWAFEAVIREMYHAAVFREMGQEQHQGRQGEAGTKMEEKKNNCACSS